MHARVYLETTIPSYLAARPSRDLVVAGHQEITRQWWEQRRNSFTLLISELVRQECQAGDVQLARKRVELLEGIPVLPANDTITQVAEQLTSE